MDAYKVGTLRACLVSTQTNPGDEIGVPTHLSARIKESIL